MSTTDDWWDDLRTAALVGTARREVPEPPALGVASPSGPREQRLLESAALGDAVRRGGRVAVDAPTDAGVDTARAETTPVAPAAAAQVLGLLLTQPPVSAAERLELVRHWATRAGAAGRRVPRALLPPLLELATTQQALRPSVAPVVGEVGRWLGRQRDDWAWADPQRTAPAGSPRGGEDGEPPGERWRTLGTDARVRLLEEVRRADPAVGLALVRETWGQDAAKDRAAHVAGLRVGITEADGEFLEECLDDRAKGVRDQAAALLDRLPGSARAARMADRLRPLIHVTGTLRKTVTVDLPDEPDPVGVRDGLGDPGPGRSKRAWWLSRTVAGAPLEVWTEATGQTPERLLGWLDDAAREPVLGGLREAALARRDAVWARALLELSWDVSLARLLPARELEERLADRWKRRPVAEAARDLHAVPTPFGPELSRAVVDAWRRAKEPAPLARTLSGGLSGALDGSVMPDLERWLTRLGPDDDRTLRTTLRDLLQEHSLRTSISEAFR